MKVYIPIILLTLISVFAANKYTDNIELTDTSELNCLIKNFQNDSVEVFNKESQTMILPLSGIKKVTIQGKGEVYNQKYKYIYNLKFLNDYLGSRKTDTDSLKSASIKNDSIDISYLPKNYRPGDHELFIMPTAYTMKEGMAYFSDYELLWLNYTYAITNSTHLSVFSMFPFTADAFEFVTFGMKQRYLSTKSTHSALWGAYMPKNGLYSLGNVITWGNQKINLNYSLGIGGSSRSNNNELAITNMIGFSTTISGKFSFISEYANFGGIDDEDFLFDMISIGIRFRGENIAWDFGGFRPLDANSDIFFLPLLKATYRFK